MSYEQIIYKLFFSVQIELVHLAHLALVVGTSGTSGTRGTCPANTFVDNINMVIKKPHHF